MGAQAWKSANNLYKSLIFYSKQQFYRLQVKQIDVIP